MPFFFFNNSFDAYFQLLLICPNPLLLWILSAVLIKHPLCEKVYILNDGVSGNMFYSTKAI